MSKPFKMKGFSGFVNSPLTKKTEKTLKTKKTDVVADSDVEFEKSQSKLWKTDERLAFVKANDRSGICHHPSDAEYAASKGYMVRNRLSGEISSPFVD